METKKSKIAAGLLGIFLGQFGVHNFYLANKSKALIQCFVSVVCWALYSIFVILGLLSYAIGAFGFGTSLAIGSFGFGIIFFLFAGFFCVGPGAMTIWSFVEAIMILAGKITVDGHGNTIGN